MCAIVKRPVAMASNLHNAIFLPVTRDILFSIAGAKSAACDEPYDKVNLSELLGRYRAAKKTTSYRCLTECQCEIISASTNPRKRRIENGSQD